MCTDTPIWPLLLHPPDLATASHVASAHPPTQKAGQRAHPHPPCDTAHGFCQSNHPLLDAHPALLPWLLICPRRWRPVAALQHAQQRLLLQLSHCHLPVTHLQCVSLTLQTHHHHHYHYQRRCSCTFIRGKGEGGKFIQSSGWLVQVCVCVCGTLTSSSSLACHLLALPCELLQLLLTVSGVHRQTQRHQRHLHHHLAHAHLQRMAAWRHVHRTHSMIHCYYNTLPLFVVDASVQSNSSPHVWIRHSRNTIITVVAAHPQQPGSVFMARAQSTRAHR